LHTSSRRLHDCNGWTLHITEVLDCDNRHKWLSILTLKPAVANSIVSGRRRGTNAERKGRPEPPEL
jgi:hypothetical protein